MSESSGSERKACVPLCPGAGGRRAEPAGRMGLARGPRPAPRSAHARGPLREAQSPRPRFLSQNHPPGGRHRVPGDSSHTTRDRRRAAAPGPALALRPSPRMESDSSSSSSSGMGTRHPEPTAPRRSWHSPQQAPTSPNYGETRPGLPARGLKRITVERRSEDLA